MATSDKLHAFAFRTLKAMSYAENERRSEHEAVMNEAKLFNLSPNEIYCYIQNNRAALDNEIQEKKMQSSTA